MNCIFNRINTISIDLCHLIYKMSLEDHVTNFHKNWIEFHLNSARKRNEYIICLYDDVNLFIVEFVRLDELKQVSFSTIREAQDRMYWHITLLDFTIANRRLIVENDGEDYITMAMERREEFYKGYTF